MSRPVGSVVTTVVGVLIGVAAVCTTGGPASAASCTEGGTADGVSSPRADPDGHTWTTWWVCGNDQGAPLYVSPSATTLSGLMETMSSWFVCFEHGATHAGGNDVWYYSQGDFVAAGEEQRRAWGFMPAANVWTSEDPWPGMAQCGFTGPAPTTPTTGGPTTAVPTTTEPTTAVPTTTEPTTAVPTTTEPTTAVPTTTEPTTAVPTTTEPTTAEPTTAVPTATATEPTFRPPRTHHPRHRRPAPPPWVTVPPSWSSWFHALWRRLSGTGPWFEGR